MADAHPKSNGEKSQMIQLLTMGQIVCSSTILLLTTIAFAISVSSDNSDTLLIITYAIWVLAGFVGLLGGAMGAASMSDCSSGGMDQCFAVGHVIASLIVSLLDLVAILFYVVWRSGIFDEDEEGDDQDYDDDRRKKRDVHGSDEDEEDDDAWTALTVLFWMATFATACNLLISLITVCYKCQTGCEGNRTPTTPTVVYTHGLAKNQGTPAVHIQPFSPDALPHQQIPQGYPPMPMQAPMYGYHVQQPLDGTSPAMLHPTAPTDTYGIVGSMMPTPPPPAYVHPPPYPMPMPQVYAV